MINLYSSLVCSVSKHELPDFCAHETLWILSLFSDIPSTWHVDTESHNPSTWHTDTIVWTFNLTKPIYCKVLYTHLAKTSQSLRYTYRSFWQMIRTEGGTLPVWPFTTTETSSECFTIALLARRPLHRARSRSKQETRSTTPSVCFSEVNGPHDSVSSTIIATEER